MKRAAFVLVLAFSISPLFAAETAPSRQLARLGFLVGSWSVEEVHPGAAGAQKGAGRLEVRPGPGGNSIISDYSSTAGPMKGESGHEVITIGDGSAYRLFWFDSDSPSPQIWSGGWEGDNLVFHYSEKIFDHDVTLVTTVSDVTASSFTMTMVASSDTKPPAAVVTLHCRKNLTGK